jgi:hypothetical protein
MTKRFRSGSIAMALISAGLLSAAPTRAVRINADGHGQALIYPYYTARSTVSGAVFATALTVVNTSNVGKALKVRFREGKAGAEVLTFNLFLSARDTWTAGIFAPGTGDDSSTQAAGIFTFDHSCTSPRVSNSTAAPTRFGTYDYAGLDAFGNDPDRTHEGYFEIVEMGAIVTGSALELAVTHKQDGSAPNASKPPCTNLPITASVPTGLSTPTGGLVGNASYINVNEGTDFSIDAVALSQWSDKVQWSAPGDSVPTIADASPAVSVIEDSRVDSDVMIVTQWPIGRDAVSALFMTDGISNDFTVEPSIKAATDWIVTLPTKRFHVGLNSATLPFRSPPLSGGAVAEQFITTYRDREGLSPGDAACAPLLTCNFSFDELPFASTTLIWSASDEVPRRGAALAGRNLSSHHSTFIGRPFINGWGNLAVAADPSIHKLVAPPGKSVVTDTVTGLAKAGMNVAYHGLPIVGFAAQSYSTTGLPGINPNVLSNYGGSFVHRYRRRIDLGE